MRSALAYAKINLALVVGPQHADGKHEVVTVLQRIDLYDTITVAPGDGLTVDGFAEDTIVASALAALARSAGVAPSWHIHIEKRIPVAAGLGGGSSDAASALVLANDSLDKPLSRDELHRLATGIGVDVPFFLRAGAQLASGDGSELTPVDLATNYVVVLVVPHGESKESTGAVYDAFDARGGAAGFLGRAERVRRAVALVTTPDDFSAFPPNDLASSPLVRELEDAGAFRADVSGAGPTVYGLFRDEAAAAAAAAPLASVGRTFVARPVAAADPA